MSLRLATDIGLMLERRILGGDLKPGARLPSVRDLAAELGAAPGTVAAAYRQLSETGLIIAGRGRQGTRVAPRPGSGLISVPRSSLPEGLVDARHGSPDPSLLPDVAGALGRAVGRTTNAYGSAVVLDELAAAAALQFRSDGIDADHLTVTNGSMDAIERVLRSHSLRVGDRVAVEDPGHIPVHQIVRSAGLIPVPLKLDDEGVLPASLNRALSLRLAAVILTPRAQNPTGAALTNERAAALTDVLDGHPEVLLIQDDHAGAVAGVEFVAVTSPSPNWVTIRSVGKSLSPDLRVSTMVGNRDTIDRVSSNFANGPGWVSYVLQAAVADLLGDPKAQRQVSKAAVAYTHRRTRLIDALGAGGVPARGRSGFNVWISVANEQVVVDAARDGGFAILGGDQWRIGSESAVRVTANRLTDDEIDRLAECLVRAVRPTLHRAASA
ncbi:MAG: aminotransferase class I/II-fold pyridoxal phosphate-dependent enzyme [Acidimicrobiales bacterium]|jgi:DNA-binding transcriptional MocR family regulator